jgi:hypothetical protein
VVWIELVEWFWGLTRDFAFVFEGLGWNLFSAAKMNRREDGALRLRVVISWVYITESAMRTLVDIPEDELEELNLLSRSRKVSRAELIRQAVAGFLAENRAGLEDSFGIWKKRGVDGVEYQEKVRSEWER